MSSMPSPSPKNPTELLDTPVQVLNAIYQAQLKQQELLGAISAQQQKLLALAQNTSAQANAVGTGLVKIIDFNMPFFALIGILIKVALASIPAAIILAIIWSIVVFVVASVLGVLGLGLGSLLRR